MNNLQPQQSPNGSVPSYSDLWESINKYHQNSVRKSDERNIPRFQDSIAASEELRTRTKIAVTTLSNYSDLNNQITRPPDDFFKRFYSQITTIDTIETDLFRFLSQFCENSEFLNSGLRRLYENFRNRLSDQILPLTEPDFFYTFKSNGSVELMKKSDFREFINETSMLFINELENEISNFENVTNSLRNLKLRYEADLKLSTKSSPSDPNSSTNTIISTPVIPSCPDKGTLHVDSNTSEPSSPTVDQISLTPKKVKKSTKRRKVDKGYLIPGTCTHCAAKETPEWRKGPLGTRTLCNACGLFFSKLIKKFGVEDALIVFNHRKSSGRINDRVIPTHDEKDELIKTLNK